MPGEAPRSEREGDDTRELPREFVPPRPLLPPFQFQFPDAGEFDLESKFLKLFSLSLLKQEVIICLDKGTIYLL